MILAPIAVGELFDKISILEIKVAHAKDPATAANVRWERDALCALRDEHQLSQIVGSLADDLAAVNARLWEVEDALRTLEAEGRFDADFVALARSVYRENDLRAALKRRINAVANSAIVEEKLHFQPGS
nr:DUF6165 family protein [Xanthobacter flavus]